MTTVSTHVLDTAHGCPAQGVALHLMDETGSILYSGMTDVDGRCRDLPVLKRGVYRLSFSVAPYYRNKGVMLADPPFLDKIVIEFGVADAQVHYHVPLLVSPFGYSTYRGS